MPELSRVPPPWLLNDVGLIEGVFNDERTAITGRPDAHNSAVLNIGNGPPSLVTVDLTKRADWGAIKTRLFDV
jgi:hypothetical protein